MSYGSTLGCGVLQSGQREKKKRTQKRTKGTTTTRRAYGWLPWTTTSHGLRSARNPRLPVAGWGVLFLVAGTCA